MSYFNTDARGVERRTRLLLDADDVNLECVFRSMVGEYCRIKGYKRELFDAAIADAEEMAEADKNSVITQAELEEGGGH